MNLNEGRSVAGTAKALGMSKLTVQLIRKRFLGQGEVRLVDPHEDNRETKVTDDCLSELY